MIEANAQTLNALGYQHLVNGVLDEALDAFQLARSLAPRNAVILNNLGNALFKLDRYHEAQNAYEEAIQLSPDYLKPYSNLALLYQLTGRSEEALATYRHYLTCVPEDGEAQHNFGLLCMNAGLKAEAAAAFASAANSLDPHDAESATKIGVSHFFCGDYARAAEFFETALTFDESYVQARYHLGIALLHLGRCVESIAALEMVIQA